METQNPDSIKELCAWLLGRFGDDSLSQSERQAAWSANQSLLEMRYARDAGSFAAGRAERAKIFGSKGKRNHVK